MFKLRIILKFSSHDTNYNRDPRENWMVKKGHRTLECVKLVCTVKPSVAFSELKLNHLTVSNYLAWTISN